MYIHPHFLVKPKIVEFLGNLVKRKFVERQKLAPPKKMYWPPSTQKSQPPTFIYYLLGSTLLYVSSLPKHLHPPLTQPQPAPFYPYPRKICLPLPSSNLDATIAIFSFLLEHNFSTQTTQNRYLIYSPPKCSWQLPISSCPL